MGLISAKTIITSLALFHITLAYFFFTNPNVIADQSTVFIIGEAMGMPHARSFEVTSPPLAFLAAIFFYTGVSDLVACSMQEEIYVFYWGSQAPTRLLVLLGLTIYSYFFSSTSPLYASSTYTPGWGEGLKNRVFFTWAFLEVVTWFWVWVTLREERSEWVRRIAMNRAEEEDRL
ncbi:hypothetical protein HYALB_00000155 [Hymenoscyphus albidus]|uniref:Increased loss of mitochondrial DNA protein 1 n=1 Tax=Hymenoscyphus albidus TaxID=595503 RepID=A0A9N9LIH1_9HELO|nr:hypothetical protein HYALB_00000155 [Hymenoscyphus albidus]